MRLLKIVTLKTFGVNFNSRLGFYTHEETFETKWARNSML